MVKSIMSSWLRGLRLAIMPIGSSIGKRSCSGDLQKIEAVVETSDNFLYFLPISFISVLSLTRVIVNGIGFSIIIRLRLRYFRVLVPWTPWTVW